MPNLICTPPDTPKKLKLMNYKNLSKNITFAKPYGFHDYIKLQMNAFCTISDSGTITEEASIFHAHLMFLEDQHFQDKIKLQIESGNTAAWSIYNTVHEYLGAFEEIKDPYLSEKGADLKDVGYRLLQNMIYSFWPWNLCNHRGRAVVCF